MPSDPDFYLSTSGSRFPWVRLMYPHRRVRLQRNVCIICQTPWVKRIAGGMWRCPKGHLTLPIVLPTPDNERFRGN
jgi:hypothetical protein